MTACTHPVTRHILVDGQPSGVTFCAACGAQLLPQGDTMIDDFWQDADLISVYTRAQAIEDGALVDVSTLAREAGFRVPVAITAGVHALLNDIPQDSGQDYTGRLWDVLWMAYQAARRAGNHSSQLEYQVIVDSSTLPATKELTLAIGPGDAMEPVMTILLPGED